MADATSKSDSHKSTRPAGTSLWSHRRRSAATEPCFSRLSSTAAQAQDKSPAAAINTAAGQKPRPHKIKSVPARAAAASRVKAKIDQATIRLKAASAASAPMARGPCRKKPAAPMAHNKSAAAARTAAGASPQGARKGVKIFSITDFSPASAPGF
jgi:hypothetical protein